MTENTTVETVLAIARRIRDQRLHIEKASDKKNFETPSLYSFGDITKESHLDVIRYFPKEPYGVESYRLKFYQVFFNSGGKLSISNISWGDNPELIPSTQYENTIKTTELFFDELPGSAEIILDGYWQPLPSVSPQDKLRAIRVSHDDKVITDIEIARSLTTGQLLIRKQQTTSMPVTADFIIVPQLDYFTPLTDSETVSIETDACENPLRELLDNNIFNVTDDHHEGYHLLRTINAIANIPKRLDALLQWLNTFSQEHNIAGEHEKLLLNILKEKQGVCRHKALVFHTFCKYWGIIARQVHNDSHAFVEVSPDLGITWRQYQLEGQAKVNVSSTPASKTDLTRFRFKKTSSSQASSSLQTRNSPESSNASIAPDEMAIKGKDLCTNMKSALISSLNSDDSLQFLNITHCFSIESNQMIKTDKQMTPLLTLWLLNDGNHYSILRTIKKSMKEIHSYSEQAQSDYINWLCDLSENVLKFCYCFIGIVQNNKELFTNIPGESRIKKLEDQLPFPEIIVKEIRHKSNISTDAFYQLAMTMPKSKYLNGKMSTIKIDQKLSNTPDTSSRLIPENIAMGLPGFYHQSTRKENKPVIIEWHLNEKNEGLFKSLFEKTDEKNPIFEIISKSSYFTENEKELYLKGSPIEFKKLSACTICLYEIFSEWVALQRLSDNHLWLFLLDQNICYQNNSGISRAPDSIEANPEANHWSKKAIKMNLKQPNAFVIQQQEMGILITEFFSFLTSMKEFPLS